MTARRRLVRVPASSANLGPGYDAMAAAVSLFLELEVEETGEYSFEPGGLDVPTGRDNLIVRSFESLHPADGIAFRLRSEIPLARGLGSSAAAIVAGLFAADHLFELALSREEVLARATAIEGHPDNVAAAIYGGFVVCGEDDGGTPTAARFDPPEGLEGLVLVEPDPYMRARLREKLARSGRLAAVSEAPAERLPFGDDEFDTAVATLVLCTVPDPEAAVAELARVLKPGGQLLFIEHVRSEDPGLARWQDRLEGPWRFLGDGCHCNRDTVATLRASSLQLDEVECGALPKAISIVRPLVRGSAVVPA